jgi:signal transduction histidine kinase
VFEVSKRPKEGRAPRSGVRSLVGYLRDRPIGIKLGFITFVPILAIVIVGANGLVAQISTTNDADRARTLATLTQYSGALVDELQIERVDATMLLGSSSKSDMAAASTAFTAQTVKTDNIAAAYTVQSSSQANLPANFRSLLVRIANQLSNLTPLRGQISGTGQIPLSAAVSPYTALISSLLQIRDDASQLAGDSTLSFEMRAAAAMASDKEYVSQEQYLVLSAFLAGSMPAELRKQVIATETGQAQSATQFQVVATAEQLSWYNLIVSGNELRPSDLAEAKIEAMQNDALPAMTVKNWNDAIGARATLLRTVEKRIDDQTVRDATTLRDAVQRQIIVDVGLLFGMVLAAMLIAWLVARSMNRSLRELKQGALNVAQNGLPQAVTRLRDPSLANAGSPQQIAVMIAEPLPVRSRDEFGQVTEAFNAVHLEAVRTAAEQAALRSSVATMFVNLARRSQILVDRLIGHLDQLERGEENPDRLAELFQLDHLATRMRRNDENLLVLAGADSTRVQREPAPLIDVLRAAQSEVEHYTRVEFGMIDRDLEVAAHAVNDLVHLVAELFDNATAFSPPDALVLVEARRVGDRAVLYVEDRGIGVSADQLIELNERLSTPPMVDVAVSRMMGLVVVARLAHRHNVKVELRPGAQRGMIADVLLPTNVLVTRSLGNRPPENPPRPVEPRAPQLPPMTQIPPRSPFSPPLALESGPSSRRNGDGPSLGSSPSGGFNGTTPNGGGSNGNNGTSRNGAGSGGFGDGPGGYRPQTPAPSLGGFAANAELFDASARELLAGSAHNRTLPSWSDLTGSPEVPGVPLAQQMFGARNVPALPLPQRRTEAPPEEQDDFDNRPRIPRQRPLDEDRLFEEFTDAELVDAPDIDDNAGAVTPYEGAPPAAAPPVWPPVAASQPSSVREETGQLQLGAGALQAAIDMTTEIPRVRELDLAGAALNETYPSEPTATDYSTDAYTSYAGDTYVDESAPFTEDAFVADTYPAGVAYDEVTYAAEETEFVAPMERPTGRPASLPPFADETMELPIFRELESAWFREPDADPIPTSPDEPVPSSDQLAEAGVRLPTGDTRSRTGSTSRSDGMDDDTSAIDLASSVEASTTMGGATMSGTARPTDSAWRSPADEGWELAAAALEPADAGTTDGGLPRRVPMAQLVPGGVEKAVTATNRRSPDAVRGLLSAYHRGVQRGRQQSDENNATSESTTGQTPSGSSREQEA